jgi:4-amino-4-deoxy-L-arabinose transferase-like glycosyltransferase
MNQGEPPFARWDRPSLLVVGALVVTKIVLHLALIGRYGFHGDELYFIECGRHLAFGYVDHPPLVPWVARVAEELAGTSLVALRLPAVLAGAGTMVFTALHVREWGGGPRAQLLALVALLVAPAHLRIAAMLDIPVIEVFLCTAASYAVARALARGERWMWVAAGFAAGLAILAKHSVLVWGAALAIGIVMAERRALATRWPWIGAAIALLVFVPNVAWQIEHGFPTLEFMQTLRGEVLEQQGRGLFVLAQVLYFHPLAVPIAIAGLVFAFGERGRAARPFAILFLAMFAFFLVAGGKPYYLASAYPPMLAAGAIAFERWLATRKLAWRSFVVALATTGAFLIVVTLPLLPLRTVDSVVGRLFGWIVPPIALTHDLHGMYGWQEHVEAVERVYRSLPEDDRARAAIVTRSYAQAAALNVLRDDPTPRATSGHMSYYLWGPEEGRGDVLIAYGVRPELLARHYRVVEERGRIDAPLARPGDTDLPIYVCRQPRGPLTELWPALRRFGHRSTGEESASPLQR